MKSKLLKMMFFLKSQKNNRFSLIYLVTVIFALSLFTSCNPDDENGKVQLVKTITLHTISDDPEKPLNYNFEYDNKNRITTVYVDDNQTIDEILYQIKYNGNDLVKFVIGNDIFMFSKNGNKITVLWNNYEDTIELNSDGYPIKASYNAHSHNSDNIVTFQYLDKNLVAATFNFSETITYKYDNKNSPFYHCKTPKWFFIYFGFLFDEIIDYDINNNKIEGGYFAFQSHYHYQYDNNNFPIKKYCNGKLYATFTY